MKKIKKLSLLALSALMAVSMSSCVAKITCISHIDTDVNGKCDNCKQAMAVPEKSNVESITVSTAPTKTYYAMGETLDTTGGMLSVKYNDGTPDAEISLEAEGVKVSAPAMDSKGEKLVSISYKGAKTTYKIEVGDKKFAVKFNLGYDGAPAIEDQLVVISNKAEKPADPTREGYDFAGWYSDAELATAFDFKMVDIIKDTELFAKWAQKFTVTYAANYAGGANKTEKTVNGKAVSTVTPDARSGYNFAGWFEDEAATKPFSFDTAITADTTIYAGWVSESVTMYTVTFNENYGTTPKKTTATVAEGGKAATPAAPSRDSVNTKGHEVSSYNFVGWYTDEKCTTAYDFNTAVTGNIELFAKWTATYIFEAEHVSLTDENGDPLQGMGASGGSQGREMVDSPAPQHAGIGPSNGFYVTYLFAPDLTLHFDITSDRDVNDVTLVLRATCETVGFVLSPSVPREQAVELKDENDEFMCYMARYTILCNNIPIEYEPIYLVDATGHDETGGRRPFSDFVIAVNLSLKKGSNRLSFISDNEQGLGGTMSATAPVIDCIKVTTSAELSWDPIFDNEIGQ